jgi:hypothetical protein
MVFGGFVREKALVDLGRANLERELKTFQEISTPWRGGCQDEVDQG